MNQRRGLKPYGVSNFILVLPQTVKVHYQQAMRARQWSVWHKKEKIKRRQNKNYPIKSNYKYKQYYWGDNTTKGGYLVEIRRFSNGRVNTTNWTAKYIPKYN